jgi:predicted nucleic acid-binding protein
MLLLDASVWVAAADPNDRFHTPAQAVVLDFDLPVAVLDLTLYEVVNAVGVKMKKADSAGYLSRLIALRCEDRVLNVDADLLEKTVAAATRDGLTAYDAAYVAAARANDWTLVSTDLADLVSKGLAVTPDAADYP